MDKTAALARGVLDVRTISQRERCLREYSLRRQRLMTRIGLLTPHTQCFPASSYQLYGR